MTKVRFFNTILNKLPEIEKENGQLLFIQDTNQLFWDVLENEGTVERKEITNIITLNTESDKDFLLTPLQGKFYFILENHYFYYYDGDDFVLLFPKEDNDAAQVKRYKETIFPTADGQHTFTLQNSYTLGANCLDVIINGILQPVSAITEIDSKTFSINEGFEITTSTQIDVSYYKALEITDVITGEQFANLENQVDLVEGQISTLVTQISNKANKENYVRETILANGWISNTYSFEYIYPNSTYNIDIEPADTCTEEQIDAWCSAKIVGNITTNVAIALGKIPTIDIPIIVKVVSK